MEAEDLLGQLGGYGKWQMMIHMLHGCIWASMGIEYSITPYIVDTPPYHCKVPTNSTLNDTIPATWDNGKLVSYEKCREYVNSSLSNETQQCSHGVYFDPDYGYESTITTDFELVCGKEIYIEITMMIRTVILGVSSIGISYLSDKYGRKTVYMVGIIGKPIIGSIEALMPSFSLQFTLSILSALCSQCILNSALLLAMEMTAANKRTVVSTSMQVFWAVGMIVATPIIFFFRDWRSLQLMVSAPMVIFYVAGLAPESITWLHSKGRTRQLERIVKQAAKCNGISPPLDLLNELNENTPHLTESKHSELPQKKGKARPLTILDAVRSPRLRMYSLAQMAIWINIAFVYDALTITTTYLPGDRYLNYLFYGLAELLAAVLHVFILMRFGRRKPLFVFHMVAGVSLMLTILEVFQEKLPFNWVPLVVVFNMLGKTGTSAVYMTMYLYTPEIYPTEIRGLVFGVCDLISYAACTISPYARVLERHRPGLLRGICGTLSIVAGFLGLLCPETHNRPLPETIEDVENMTNSMKNDTKETASGTKEVDTDLPLNTYSDPACL